MKRSFRKLRRMSPREILFRAGAEVRHRIEETAFALGWRGTLGDDTGRGTGPAVPFISPWLLPQQEQKVVERLLSSEIEYVTRTLGCADSILAGSFELLDAATHFPARIPWARDPVHGGSWPRTIHTKIDIFAGGKAVGDVKHVWELNRHQFLPVLGKAYRLSGEEGYAEAGLSLIEDWIRENPYKIGINWTSALEVAVRSLSWCWACALFEGAPPFSPERHRLIRRSLAQHARYAEQHLSIYFSPYNHLIGEAAALYAIGTLLPELRPSARWRRLGWKLLTDQLPLQFHEDGGTVEQASGYHYFTLGFYLQALLLRRRAGEPVGEEFLRRLERAFEHGMILVRPDGMTPMIGDGDQGKALELEQGAPWDHRPYLAIGAALFDRADFRAASGRFPPDAAWLIGTEGWNRYESLSGDATPVCSRAQRASGYCVMRTGWDPEAHYLLFDCGDLAAGVARNDAPGSAHGHADALTVEVTAYGCPLLLDPGFFTYNGDSEWHRYFRETEAHNTIVVGGRSQARYRGRLTWSDAPEVRLEQWFSSPRFDFAAASHDGFRTLSPGLRHRRSILFMKPDYWLVRDEMLGEGTWDVDRYFHFAPCHVEYDLGRRILRAQTRDGAGLCLLALEKEGLVVDTWEGGRRPEDGWVATAYGKKVAACVARLRTRIELPASVHTLLAPCRPGLSEPGDVVELPVEPQGTRGLRRAFEVRHQGKRDLMLFSDGKGIVSFGGTATTDALVACMRWDALGAVDCYAMIEGTRLEAGRRTLAMLPRISSIGT